MAIRYQPKRLLKKMAPDTVVERLVTKKLTVNRAVLSILTRAGILSAKEIERIALRVIRDYKKEYRAEIAAGSSQSDSFEDVVGNNRVMVQRVKQATVAAITDRVKARYRGEFYIWLDSTAKNPDPKHMKKYGKRYQIGRGEAPGDRYGCQCGMEILIKARSLDLDE